MRNDQGDLLDAYPLDPNLDYKFFCGPRGENLVSFVKLVLGVFTSLRVWLCVKKKVKNHIVLMCGYVMILFEIPY